LLGSFTKVFSINPDAYIGPMLQLETGIKQEADGNSRPHRSLLAYKDSNSLSYDVYGRGFNEREPSFEAPIEIPTDENLTITGFIPNVVKT